MLDQPITHNELQQMLIIAEKNAAHSESIAESLKSLVEGVNCIKADSWKVKWFVGIVAIGIIVVTSVVTVVARGVDNRNLFKSEVRTLVSEIQAAERAR